MLVAVFGDYRTYKEEKPHTVGEHARSNRSSGSRRFSLPTHLS
jgi:hypothetical protein